MSAAAVLLTLLGTFCLGASIGLLPRMKGLKPRVFVLACGAVSLAAICINADKIIGLTS